MKITYLGHSAFLIEDQSNTILIDPFLIKSPFTLDELIKKVNFILLTHAHADHFGETLHFSDAKVIANPEIIAYLNKKGFENTISGNTGGKVQTEFGSVEFTKAFHSSSFEDGTYGGMPNGLIITIDNKRIYHAGDTDIFSDMQYIKNIDVALLPIGDVYTMDAKKATQAAEIIGAKINIPMHFATFPILTQSADEFLKLTKNSQELKIGDHLEL